MSLYTQTVLNVVPPAPGRTALQTRRKAIQDGSLESTQMPELAVERSALSPIVEIEERSVNSPEPESEKR